MVGAILGLGFSRILQYTHKQGYVDKQSYLVQSLAFAIFTAGVIRTFGSDDLLAVFAAGTAYPSYIELLLMSLLA